MTRAARAIVLVLFGCSGLSALLYEVVWTRMLTLHFGATAPSLAAVLSSFMGGLALGSAAAVRLSPRLRRPLFVYGALELGIAATAVAFPFLLRLTDPLLQAAYSEEGPTTAFILLRFGIAFLSLLPTTLLMGATFPVLAQALVVDRERTAADAGLAYGINTLGAMLGAGLSGFVFIRLFGMTVAMGIAVAVNVAIGVVAMVLWSGAARRGAASSGRGTAPAGHDVSIPGAVPSSTGGSAGLESAARSFSSTDAHRQARRSQVDQPRGLDRVASTLTTDRASPTVADASAGRATEFSVGDEREMPDHGRSAATARWLPVLLCGFSGLASLAYEVLWTRFFINSALSTTIAFSCILIAYLGGLGLGAVIASRVAKADRSISLAHVALLQAMVAVCVVVLVPTLEQLPRWFNSLEAASGSYLLTNAVLVTGVMFIPTVLLGMVLPLCVHLVRATDPHVSRVVGRIYAASSLGSAIGPLLAAFVLLPNLGVTRSLLVIAAGQAAVALMLTPWRAMTAARVVRLGAVGASVAALLFAAGIAVSRDPSRRQLLPRYDAFLNADARVLAYREGAHGTAMVSEEAGGRRALYLDGFLSTSNLDNTEYMAMMAHLPLMARPGAKDVLVICLGTGMTAGAATLHDIDRLDIVELNPDVAPMTRYFERENHDVLGDPRTRVVFDDGRNYLRRTSRQYDVITLEPLAPSFAGTVNLYTREFNALARSKLRPGGVFAQWLPYHLVTDYKSRMIVQAAEVAFPYVAVWVDPLNYSAIVLGSDQPIRLQPVATLTPEALEDLRRFHYDDSVISDYLAVTDERISAYVSGAPAVTDNHPYLEYPHPSDFERARSHEELFDRRVDNLFKAGGRSLNEVLRNAAARAGQGQR